MALSPELKRMVSAAKAQNGASLAKHHVPHAAAFAKLSIVDQYAAIDAVQRELDGLTEGFRSGCIKPNHRGRGAALRDLRTRQKRLDALAASFGFRREWRKRITVKATSRLHEPA